MITEPYIKPAGTLAFLYIIQTQENVNLSHLQTCLKTDSHKTKSDNKTYVHSHLRQIYFNKNITIHEQRIS
jgi:hypothetical protein